MRSMTSSASFITRMDCLVVVIELLQPPVAEHAGMQEELVDGSQLVFEHLVENIDNLLVAFHNSTPFTDQTSSGFVGNWPGQPGRSNEFAAPASRRDPSRCLPVAPPTCHA